MNNKSIALYTVIFLVLVALAYLIVIDRGEKTVSYKLPENLITFDSASIDKLVFVKNDQTFVIANVGGIWMLTEPVNYRVEQKFVPLILSDLKNYRIESLVSDNPTARNNFGFHDTNFLSLQVFENGNLSGVLEIGNAGSGASQTFIKLPDDDKIFLASSFLRNNFVRSGLDEWRDKLIFSIQAPSVEVIEFNFPNESYKLSWDTLGNYYVDGVAADTTAVDAFLNIMQNFNTQRFYDESIVIDDSFNYVIRVITKNDTTVLRMKKLSEDEENDYLLKVSGIDQIFRFNQALAGNLIRSRSDYLRK